MQDNLGTKIDTKEMTLLEELEDSRSKLRDEISKAKDKETLFNLKVKLGNVNHQILMRKLIAHRYSS